MTAEYKTRLYGLTQGYGSYAQVTRGFAEALTENGVEHVLVPMEDSDDEVVYPGAFSKSGVLTGPPTHSHWLRQNARHERRQVMLAPNSTWLPPDLMRALNELCTEILVPSRWAASIVEQYTKLPVRVVPHGISWEFMPSESDDMKTEYERESFWVLHLSSTGHQRKGTRELLRAWMLLQERRLLPSGAKLFCVLPRESQARLQYDMESWPTTGVRMLPRLGARENGLPPREMSLFYSRMHVLCQPSRGEAFGMCCVEARACGLPVVATECTGHSEHMHGAGPEVGVVCVPHGKLEPIDDGPDAMGPAVDVEELAVSLSIAYNDWLELKSASERNAEPFRQRWMWRSVLQEFCAELKA